MIFVGPEEPPKYRATLDWRLRPSESNLRIFNRSLIFGNREARRKGPWLVGARRGEVRKEGGLRVSPAHSNKDRVSSNHNIIVYLLMAFADPGSFNTPQRRYAQSYLNTCKTQRGKFLFIFKRLSVSLIMTSQ